MAILILGDTHIGNHIQFGGETVEGLNRRCREICNAIKLTVADAIRDHGVTDVVQIGDFFDTARPNFAVLCAAMELIKSSGVRWHIVAGNHDRAGFNAPCSVSPLGELPNVWTYEKVSRTEICGIPFVMVPYTGSESSAALAQAMKLVDAIGATNIALACHYGLVDNPSRSDHVKRSDLVSYKNTTYFFGHEHCSRTELDILNSNGRKAKAISVGSFGGVNFHDSTSDYRSCIVRKSGSSIKASQYPNNHAPIFITAHTMDGIREVRNGHSLAPLYVRSASEIEGSVAEKSVELGITAFTVQISKTSGIEKLRTELRATADSDVLVDAVAEVSTELQEQELVYEEAIRSMEKHVNK